MSQCQPYQTHIHCTSRPREPGSIEIWTMPRTQLPCCRWLKDGPNSVPRIRGRSWQPPNLCTSLTALQHFQTSQLPCYTCACFEGCDTHSHCAHDPSALESDATQVFQEVQKCLQAKGMRNDEEGKKPEETARTAELTICAQAAGRWILVPCQGAILGAILPSAFCRQPKLMLDIVSGEKDMTFRKAFFRDMHTCTYTVLYACI